MHAVNHRISLATPSKFMDAQKDRLQKAVKRRLNAFQKDQKLSNLIRPPGTGETQLRFSWGKAYFDEPVRDNVVFYESFAGNGALCNPNAVFEYLLNDPSKSHLTHVWSIRDSDERARFKAKYAHFKNVKAVKHNSTKYWQELSTAKYLFNNATFAPFFTKRAEQVYVNTWHGTPLKTMGYDSNEGAFGARNILRNFVQADYLVSPNEFTTDVMYRSAYKLDGIFAGKIVEQGYPRIDAQFASSGKKTETQQALAESGLKLSGKKVVLYAPTWKGSSFQKPDNEASQLLVRMRTLEEALGDKYDFALKVHQQVYKFAMELPELKQYLVPNEIPTNDVLALSEVLITDYSSIFFDFLATEKPILFFTPDQASYHGERGVYLETLPGPSLQELDLLVETLGQLGTGTENDIQETYRQRRQDARQTYCGIEDGKSTERLVSIIFDGNRAGLAVKTVETSAKQKILMYVGGMRNNGITTSALNLLTNIDYSKYDVSIWAPQPSKSSPAFLYERIPSEVRQFLRQGTHPLTAERNKLLKSFLEDGKVGTEAIPDNVKEVLSAEWDRNFGSTNFDYVVDFSGYAGFWSFVLLQGKSKKSHSIWQHNDLLSDRDREVDGKYPNFKSLSSVFKSYKYFDNLVSVSEDLMEINKGNLQEFAPHESFKACHNTVDVRKVENALRTQEAGTFDSQAAGLQECGDLTAVIDRLLDFTDKDNLTNLVASREKHKKIFATPNVTRFVTAGRMSPEKNQARLLRAFALVHQARPETELVLLGDGALRSELEDLASELGIKENVVFAGMVDDALIIMKDCDCFVLSSDYEGQPMVILEASSVGIPVITVAFGSVRNSLGPERGVVVEQDVDELSEAMISFVDGKISREVSFDYGEYNARTMQEFYAAIEPASH